MKPLQPGFQDRRCDIGAAQRSGLPAGWLVALGERRRRRAGCR
jgi:hypothetical protein